MGRAARDRFRPFGAQRFEHLIANSSPLLVLITVMVFLYPNAVLRTLPAVWLGSGLFVGLFGKESMHFGAGGLVYGLASYVLVAGLLRRDRRAIAASLVVWFMYGPLVWGLLQTPVGVSWETHLAAALIGVASAIAFRRAAWIYRRASATSGRTKRKPKNGTSLRQAWTISH